MNPIRGGGFLTNLWIPGRFEKSHGLLALFEYSLLFVGCRTGADWANVLLMSWLGDLV